MNSWLIPVLFGVSIRWCLNNPVVMSCTPLLHFSTSYSTILASLAAWVCVCVCVCVCDWVSVCVGGQSQNSWSDVLQCFVLHLFKKHIEQTLLKHMLQGWDPLCKITRVLYFQHSLHKSRRVTCIPQHSVKLLKRRRHGQITVTFFENRLEDLCHF